ncbi:MAG: formimidoylglutamate deiminase, partial [Xanthobacteraceae bacterium]|nr:formimidoylglutamate deiminase [Xanthobacteraceae bacterium]
MSALHVRDALLPDGWARDVRIEITDAAIRSIATSVASSPGDERHAIAVPGVASVHSHAFQRGMAGLAEVRGSTADTFWTWRDTMYRFALSMTPEDVEAVALQLYCEMLEAGFTRVGEFHYLHHDRDGTPYANIAEVAARIVSAAGQSGIGLTLLPSFYAHATFGGSSPHAGQRRFICDVDQFARLIEASTKVLDTLPGATIGVAPHSLRAVTPSELTAIVALAKKGPVHIHVAEQEKEVEDCIAWCGQRPVEWLLANAPVDERWCLIHATHMADTETTAVTKTGAVVGLCPVTEASLGDGTFPARTFLNSKGRFGIGTDSNVLIGVADELRQLEYGQRLALRERNVFAADADISTGRTLLEAAVRGGAHALAQPTSGLAEGARADIVTLDANHPSLASRKG